MKEKLFVVGRGGGEKRGSVGKKVLGKKKKKKKKKKRPHACKGGALSPVGNRRSQWGKIIRKD